MLLLEPELTEIFQANPAELSDEQFIKLIQHYRAERATWQEKESKPKAPAKGSIIPDLGDLGL